MGSPGKIAIGVVGALACLAVLAAAAGAARAKDTDPFDFGNPSFCDAGEYARDFGLSALPPVHELSEREAGRELGHPAVSVYGGWSRVMPRPEEYGYGFSEDDHEGPVRVDWTVTARLWSVDAEGDTIEEVGHTGLFLKAIDAAHQPHIGLKPPGRRGFYRFDLRFESGGRVIGSYSSYFKLVPPSWRARLRLSRTVARPGQQILSRVESLGSEGVSYGESFSVERERKGGWIPAPGLTPQAWFAWAGFITPGGIGRCSALLLPKDVAPGHYRVVKYVGRSGGSRRGKGVLLEAPFQVASP